jgi:hypothetical protein
MQKQTFKRGMGILAKSFPEKEMDFDILWSLLFDLKDDDFIKAIGSLIATKTEINRATNIIALIREFAEEKKATAGEAWGEVLREVGRVGSWGIPKFSDPLIQSAVECVGWQAICSSEEIMIERAHFLKIYDSIAQRRRIEVIGNSAPIQNLIDMSKDIKNLTSSVMAGMK